MSDRTTPNPSEREVPPDQSQEEVPLDQPEQEASLDQPERGLFGSWATWPRLLAGIGLIVLLGAAFLLGTRFGSQASQGATRTASVPASPTPMSGISTADSPAATATVQQEATLTPTPQPTPSPTATPDGPIYPLAVIVENMSDARPQSGLAEADVVYEALVEGGITRFLAIYKDGRADVIGPVRSARHYYVYLAAEFNATLVHIGSSPQGFRALDETGIINLGEIYGDPGIWRSNARYAPHNAYTSTELLRESLDKVRNLTPGSMAGFQIDDGSRPSLGAAARGLTVYYPGGYQVSYGYSPEDKLYLRSMDGIPHEDADSGERVSPRNVVVQFIKSWEIDEVGRLEMQQVGEGKALLFRDGVVTEGSWRKLSYTAPTQWLDANGRPLMMSPGKTWVQMIPPGTEMDY